jgi:hypothetical protein
VVTVKNNIGKAANLSIELKPGMTMLLDCTCVKHAGNMVGLKANATGKVYHVYQYDHTQGVNCYQGTLMAGKRRMPMKARIL